MSVKAVCPKRYKNGLPARVDLNNIGIATFSVGHILEDDLMVPDGDELVFLVGVHSLFETEADDIDCMNAEGNKPEKAKMEAGCAAWLPFHIILTIYGCECRVWICHMLQRLQFQQATKNLIFIRRENTCLSYCFQFRYP